MLFNIRIVKSFENLEIEMPVDHNFDDKVLLGNCYVFTQSLPVQRLVLSATINYC